MDVHDHPPKSFQKMILIGTPRRDFQVDGDDYADGHVDHHDMTNANDDLQSYA
jgi:hypothetical protein